MAKLKIICVGRLKDNFIRQGIAKYDKRLSAKKIEVIEIKDSTKKKENEELLTRIEKICRHNGSYVIALHEHGEEFNSVEFSAFIKAKQDMDIVFIIGGPDGLDDSVTEKADKLIALSKMTFTHEIARLLLYEQFYRAYSIMEGKKYHRK